MGVVPPPGADLPADVEPSSQAVHPQPPLDTELTNIPAESLPGDHVAGQPRHLPSGRRQRFLDDHSRAAAVQLASSAEELARRLDAVEMTMGGLSSPVRPQSREPGSDQDGRQQLTRITLELGGLGHGGGPAARSSGVEQLTAL